MKTSGATFAINEILASLREAGPMEFRCLTTPERAWRGRYFMMARAMGASPDYAWFNALSSLDDHNEQARQLVESTDDSEILVAYLAGLDVAPEQEVRPIA